MITPHHSFSTRIFLEDKKPAAKPGSRQPFAAAQPEDEVRDFWWFLRGARPARGAGRPRHSSPDEFPHQGDAHA